MKYVRTKDEIHQIDKRIALCNIPPWLQTGDEDKFYPAVNNAERGVLESEILKEADTIEELCDALVSIKTDGLPLTHNLPKGTTLNWIRNVLIKALKKDCVVKQVNGAIWTDKGLIYVAKLNEKGELELL